jgi:hypothetical protein
MNNIRAKFEEIWPVPDYAIWCRSTGLYWYLRHDLESPLEFKEWNDRLDTFTRCQETMAPVMSLIEEMVVDIEYLLEFADGNEPYSTTDTLNRAKELLGERK